MPDQGNSMLSWPGSSERPTNLDPQAFQHWKVIKARLAHTIQLYLEACLALGAASTSPLLQGSSPYLTEISYRKVDTEVYDLVSSEENLRRSRAVLAKIRNRSRALAPISALPSEILAAILCSDSDECLRTCFAPVGPLSRPKPPAWASVCTQWRQLYHQWHITSSHLDLVVGGGIEDAYYDHAETRASRSHGASLHLVIKDRVDRTIDDPVSSSEIARLVGFISPLMPRVCGLDLEFKYEAQLLLDSVIACWVRNGSSAPPKFFKVWNSMKAEPLRLGLATELSSEVQVSQTEYRDFFCPLQTLVLQQCYVPSDDSIFKDLASLHLDWSDDISTPLDILEILAASPALRTLAIDDVNCVKYEDSPEAAFLGSLENLSISQYVVKKSLSRALPLLNTGSNSINLAMRILTDPDFIPESRDFFRRSSVKRLFTYGLERFRCTQVAQLCPAPDLEELVLRDCSLIIDHLATSSSSMTDGNCYVRTPWPLLHTLYLIRCTIKRDKVRQLVALHPIRKLRIHCGYTYDREDGDRRKMTAKECAELEDEFLGMGVDVKCVQHQIDCPTRVNFFDGLYA
ncbi:hypothetical protein FRC10_003450 [Ceratobasidium sp. 414]|nr:hypothetical protein FRC10_003450 [Ceratobasidium sp. 414]